MPKLTKRVTENLRPKGGAEHFIWDSEVTGFGIRIKPSGSSSYLIQYRNSARRTRRLVLGHCGILSLEEARAIAREKLVEVIKGEDPSAARKTLLKSKTVADLCGWYLEEAEPGRLLGRKRRPIKPASPNMARSSIERHVVPLIGQYLVKGLTKQDVEKLMTDIAAGKTAAAREGRGGVTTGGTGVAVRTITVLHAIFAHAIRLGLVEANPCRGIRKPASRIRERRLSESEIIQLGKVMTEMGKEGESPTGIMAIRFILVTGFRRNEALQLKTSWLGKGCSYVSFPDTKTGRQIRIIGKAAADLIRTRCSLNDATFVFPADVGDGHFVGAPRVLARITRRAGFTNVTLHSLRHTFASMAAELGFSELTIAGLLGHSTRGVTQRYVHLDEALVVAAERVAHRIHCLLSSNDL